jgi:hypothetical protein
MEKNNKPGWIDQAVVAGVFALIGLAVLAWFVLFGDPPERRHRAAFRQDYAEAELETALSKHAFEGHLAAIAAAGSRQTGSPGCRQAESLISNVFHRAGLDIAVQQFTVTVPVTDICEIRDAATGQPLDGVRLAPFMPAGLMPVSCSFTTRLVSVESAELRWLSGLDPRGVTVITPVDGGATWPELAGAGVQALIVHDTLDQRALRASPDQAANWAPLAPAEETPFPRFCATGPIESFTGRTVVVDCRVTWQTRTARNLLGVLRSRAPRAEALVVNAYYDSSSVVPDLAPGAEQSVPAAALLDLVESLSSYRDILPRDIVFVATAGHGQGLAGVSQLMEGIERFSAKRTDYQSFEIRRAEQESLFRQPDEARLCRIAAGEIHLQRREHTLAARLAYLRAGSPVYRDGFDASTATDEQRKAPGNVNPLLQAYLEARRADNEAANRVSMSARDVLADPACRAAFDRLRGEALAWHRDRIRELDDLILVRDLFARYRNVVALNLELNSGGSKGRSTLSLLTGIYNIGPSVDPQSTDIANLLMAKSPGATVLSWGARDAAGSMAQPNRNSPWLAELESEPWFHCGQLAFSVCNHEFLPTKLGTPEDDLTDLNLEALRRHVPAVGRLVLALAGGQVDFKTLSAGKSEGMVALRGSVFGDAGASTMIPSHPMGVRTVVRAIDETARTRTPLETRGITLFPVVACSPYGTFERPLAFNLGVYMSVSVDAARFDEAGRIAFIGDRGAGSQSVYPCVSIDTKAFLATGGRRPPPINAAMFRATPVALYQRQNPQTQQPFKAAAMLSRQGLDEPGRRNANSLTTFVEPDLAFFVSFMDGAAENPEILTPRAFMLNVASDEAISRGEPELEGRGYLAADTPALLWPQLDTAASMLRTAEKRLQLQRKFRMADGQMLAFHARGGELLKEAEAQLAGREPLKAVNSGSASLAYAMANHPVIRGRIAQAVVGILWYLGLLVPFVFFAEKLLFGFSDIRKQLLADTAIFLVVFALLRTFHPAFEMVRSSIMILLGFVILLLTLLVTLMIGGKFMQNLKDLRRREGQVEGADINRGGVIGTAFMLGLNNMRRRKVRTGLTCATLILITFGMICFTSVTTDLTDVEYPTGRSGWNGIMVRDTNYQPLSAPQINAIGQMYGSQYPVATIQWLTPLMTGARLQNPDIQIDRSWQTGGQTVSRRVTLNSAVEMSWQEPSFSGIDAALVTHRGWFPRPPQTPPEIRAAALAGERSRNAVILPLPAARDLGLTPELVDATNVMVTIRGEEYEVLGLFDPGVMGRIQGLDGRSLMPFDLNSVQQVGAKEGNMVLPEDVGRLSPSQVMLVNRMPPLKGEQIGAIFCSVLFPRTAYRLRSDEPERPAVDYPEQRRLVTDYLERLGKPAYYAVDGTSYYGARTRARTFAGLLDLLIPILIASLTVFNTMRSSVYERKDEIYVYNAVGIAPNHVFFMFMAEAAVYAVVGAMCGYVLSQASGRTLTALGLTGGLNMDYSSIETIYASLAIMAAVLLSTLLPARDASRMASPSGLTGWRLPPAVDDTMEFSLPFTFTAHDRVAVIAYFRRWLDANGAGSSGLFYCSPPEPLLQRGEELTPALRSTVWLKPYDLGVSQRIEISLPTDPDTREFIAHIRITRLSGHTAAWQRTVKPFLGSLRKQFLNWRATTPEDRSEMFAEASSLLATCPIGEKAHE